MHLLHAFRMLTEIVTARMGSPREDVGIRDLEFPDLWPIWMAWVPGPGQRMLDGSLRILEKISPELYAGVFVIEIWHPEI